MKKTRLRLLQNMELGPLASVILFMQKAIQNLDNLENTRVPDWLNLVGIIPFQSRLFAFWYLFLQGMLEDSIRPKIEALDIDKMFFWLLMLSPW